MPNVYCCVLACFQILSLNTLLDLTKPFANAALGIKAISSTHLRSCAFLLGKTHLSSENSQMGEIEEVVISVDAAFSLVN